ATTGRRLSARPTASPRPPMRGIAPLWMRRNWSGLSIAPAHAATRVTRGVASTHPMKASAKMSRQTLETIGDAIPIDQDPLPTRLRPFLRQLLRRSILSVFRPPDSGPGPETSGSPDGEHEAGPGESFRHGRPSGKGSGKHGAEGSGEV